MGIQSGNCRKPANAPEKKHVAFPLFSHYNLCIKYFVEQALDAEYIMQPPMTNRTMEIGSRYSPDSVYTPFKSSLGSLIDALEAGAETLKMLAYLDGKWQKICMI